MLIDLVMKQLIIYERVNNSFIQIDKTIFFWWNIDFFFSRLHRMWYTFVECGTHRISIKKKTMKNFRNVAALGEGISKVKMC